MSALYHDIRDAVIADVDSVLAETVRLSPMNGGVSDPERSAQDLTGVLRTADQKPVRFAAGRDEVSRSIGASVPAAGATLAIDPGRYPDLDIRTGDMVRAVSRPLRPVYKVNHVDADGHHRLMVYLNQAGR